MTDLKKLLKQYACIAKSIRQKLQKEIDAIEENEHIQRIGGNCFVVQFSELQKWNVMSAEFYVLLGGFGRPAEPVQHNVDYVITAISVAVFLYDQPHIFHTLTVFIAGINNINAGGVDTAVTENVGELGNILFNAVKSAGEQMAQIVGKHLLRIHVCLLAKPFHFPPYIRAAHRFAASSDEYSARAYFLRLRIAEQLLPQFTDNKYRSCFAFEGNNRFSVFYSFNSDILQLAHTDTRTA